MGWGLAVSNDVYAVSESHTGTLLIPFKNSCYQSLGCMEPVFRGFWRNAEVGHQELASCLFHGHLYLTCSTLETSQTSRLRKMIHKEGK